MQFNKPILLITFNRPETTKRVLEAVSRAKPARLYVFSDAPREGNDSDQQKVEEVRRLFQNLSWSVDLRTNFQTNNLGCGKGVTSAISWVLQNEETVIILEDDCLPEDSFFDFCSLMLDKYAGNEKVMHISGTQWNPEFKTEHSCLFSSIGHVWGWATWRRAWLKYDYDMIAWQDHLPKVAQAMKKPLYIMYWKELFTAISGLKKKHTWDYQWQYALFREGGLAVVPDVNLIENIGSAGTHFNSSDANDPLSSYLFGNSTSKWQFKSTPAEVKQNRAYDLHHMNRHFFRFTGRLKRLKKLVKYYVKGG